MAEIKLVQKTVFISYRRTNLPWALNVFQYLTNKGYDVFFDYEGIGSGDFGAIILANVISRAHFLVLLTPSALEKCANPNDWLRQEIETAIDNKRNVVPLLFEGFDFDSPKIASELTGKLATLKGYNGLTLYAQYFIAAMERLCNQFLNVHLDAVPHPTPVAQQAATEQKTAAEAAPPVQQQELTAQQYFERAYASSDPDEQIRLYTEAIRLQPDFVEAFGNRGNAYQAKGELDAAILDYDRAIQLQPDYAIAFYNRGNAHDAKGELHAAILDYNHAIQISPDYADAFINRGIAFGVKGELDAAILDFERAIQFQPDLAEAFVNRGNAHYEKDELDAAILDYDRAIQLQPDYAVAFYNRGKAHRAKGELDTAILDYNRAIQLQPDYVNAFYNRGTLLQRMGRNTAAIADLRQYLALGGGIRDGDTEEVEQWISEIEAEAAENPPNASTV